MELRTFLSFMLCIVAIASAQDFDGKTKQNTVSIEDKQGVVENNINTEEISPKLVVEEESFNAKKELDDDGEDDETELVDSDDLESDEKEEVISGEELEESIDKTEKTKEKYSERVDAISKDNEKQSSNTNKIEQSIEEEEVKELVQAENLTLSDDKFKLETKTENEIQEQKEEERNKSNSKRPSNIQDANKKPLKQKTKPEKKKPEIMFEDKRQIQDKYEDGTKSKKKTNVVNQNNMGESAGQKLESSKTDQKQEQAKNITMSPKKPLNTAQLQENKKERKKTQQYPKNDTIEDQEPKSKQPSQHPHIVFIMADDLGWDDVSFHGSDQIMTPNIDTLAYTGVVLAQYYTDVQGTASRSALFTGKLPVRLGTQGDSIKASEDRGIPVSEVLLPSYLRKQGYATHLVGKWDVGKSREHYLPTSRGFDTFYGFLGSAVDYYTYNLIEETNQTSFFGLDFFDGITPVEKQQGHLTEVLTNKAVQIIRDHKPEIPLYLHLSHAAPHAGGGLVNLQAPESDIQANDHIAHSARRIYAGLVTNLDKSIGHVIAALAERDMLENTMIVFVSDNGAPTIGEMQNYGSNLPLRGLKNTPWEGGARSTAVVWYKSLPSWTCNSLFHITDWLPTLVRAAGGNLTVEVDGIDQWDILVDPEKPPKRLDVLVSINKDWAALREGHFKLVVGNVHRDRSGYQGLQLKVLRHKPPPYDTTILKSETYMVFKETLNLVLDVDEALSIRKESSILTRMNINDTLCIPRIDKGCLYNITADPIEAKDLWDVHPDIVRRLTLRLRTFWSDLKARTTKQDLRADPKLHKYIWMPWIKNDEVKLEPNLGTPPFPLQVSMGELQYLVDLNLNMFRDKMYESVKSMGDSFLKSVSGLFNF